jgi:anthranilate synthase component I
VKIRSEFEEVPISGVDLFHFYESAAESIGAENVFLLESLQGPEIDCQQSVLGVYRLAEIIFTRNSVAVTGEDAVCRHINTVICNALGRDISMHEPKSLHSTDEYWSVLRSLLKAFEQEQGDFRFGYLASISYDTGRLIENIVARLPSAGPPLVVLALFQAHMVVTPEKRAFIALRHIEGVRPLSVAAVSAMLAGKVPTAELLDRPPASVEFTMERHSYIEAATRALEHIRAGNIYQVQLGHEIRVQTAMSPTSLYRNLRQNNPSPYMFLARLADVDLIGASPESYIRLNNGTISMRPIAGTLSKTSGQAKEEQIAILLESAKENAEHIMLVDLCRNDIGRVCSDKGLMVPELMIPGEFSNLFHLISTVTGDLRPGSDVVDVLRATFPAGTMVGAPKVRAMEVIEELECSRRGHYAGGLGILGFGNFANMALCIRMATRESDSTYRIRASAGIVFDSCPLAEWNETLVKMNRMYEALTGEELTA